MTPKRVKAISAKKKRDHLMTGTRTANTKDGTAVQYVNIRMDGLPRAYIWSPTWMPHRNRHSDYAREASRVHHTSFAEKMSIDIPCDVSVNHRRIVYRTGYEDIRTICGRSETVDGKIVYDTFRNFTENPFTDFGSIFQGAQNTDWYSWIRAPLNRKKVTVMYDRVHVYAPVGEHGKEYQKKFYHKVNQWYDFPEEENGGDTNRSDTTDWPGIKSDKVFVLDIFESSRDTRDAVKFPLGEQYFAVSLESTNYWTEP